MPAIFISTIKIEHHPIVIFHLYNPAMFNSRNQKYVRIIVPGFNTRKKPTKNNVDPLYCAMFLVKLFSVLVHSWEIQINLRSIVYSMINDAMTFFSLSNFLMTIAFRLATSSKKKTPTQVFSCEYYKIFKSTYFEEHLRMPPHEYHFI